MNNSRILKKVLLIRWEDKAIKNYKNPWLGVKIDKMAFEQKSLAANV